MAQNKKNNAPRGRVEPQFNAAEINQQHWHYFGVAIGKTKWWRNKNGKFIIDEIEFIRTCEIYKKLSG